ncbi:MAG: MFS transporter, partial [Chloroflexota bacterium]
MFYGWWIVVFAFLASGFGGATIWYGFTAFFDPLIKEFGWSYTAISLAASLRGVEIGLLDVVVGFLVDRFGGRAIIFGGSLLIGVGYLLLSRVDSLATFYLSFIIIFIGGSGISNVVFFSVITRWFRKRLGLALGLVTVGVGAGGFALPGIVQLMNLVGFRQTFVIFGITAFAVGALTAYFVRSRPEDIGLGPDGISLNLNAGAGGSSPTSPAESPPQYPSFRESIRSAPFWAITYASLTCAFALMMVTTHVMPYLEHTGYSRSTASVVAMMIPVLSMVGRLGGGWVS